MPPRQRHVREQDRFLVQTHSLGLPSATPENTATALCERGSAGPIGSAGGGIDWFALASG